MRERITLFVARSLVSLIICSVAVLATAHISSAIEEAVWVWPDPTTGTPITDTGGPETLVANASQSGVTELFVSVYSSTTSSTGRQMFADALLKDLILQAHADKMTVWAEYGDPSWITFACADNSFPLQRMADVLNYNQANPSAPFDGIVLDVEPSPSPTPTATPTPSAIRPTDEGPSGQQLQQLLAFYDCIIRKVPLPISAAISPFWTAPVVAPFNAFFQQVIQLKLAHVIVMGYRNTVGTTDCLSDGIACLDGPTISYWENCPTIAIGGCQQARSGNILAGLETSSTQAGNVTFFTQGQTAMNQAASAMEVAFPNGGLVGFAIDAYQNAYLGSVSPNWPSTNPDFPGSSLLKKHSKSKSKTPMK